MTGQAPRYNHQEGEPSSSDGRQPPSPIDIPLVDARLRTGNVSDPRKTNVFASLTAMQNYLNQTIEGGVTVHTGKSRDGPNRRVTACVLNESGKMCGIKHDKNTPVATVAQNIYQQIQALVADRSNNVNLSSRGAKYTQRPPTIAPVDLEGIEQSNVLPSLGRIVDERSAARPAGPPATRGGMNNAAGRGRGGAVGATMVNRGGSNVVRRRGAGDHVVRRGPTGDQQ